MFELTAYHAIMPEKKKKNIVNQVTRVLENSAACFGKRDCISGFASIGIEVNDLICEVSDPFNHSLSEPVLAAARGVYLKQWQFYSQQRPRVPTIDAAQGSGRFQ